MELPNVHISNYMLDSKIIYHDRIPVSYQLVCIVQVTPCFSNEI
jgi:hypothetical protein